MSRELAQSMLEPLAKHEHTIYHFLLTGDESETFYADGHRTISVTSWDDVDEIERPSHFHQRTMFQISSMAQGNAKLRFLQRDKR
jgi:hypothetical protein